MGAAWWRPPRCWRSGTPAVQELLRVGRGLGLEVRQWHCSAAVASPGAQAFLGLARQLSAEGNLLLLRRDFAVRSKRPRPELGL